MAPAPSMQILRGWPVSIMRERSLPLSAHTNAETGNVVVAGRHTGHVLPYCSFHGQVICSCGSTHRCAMEATPLLAYCYSFAIPGMCLASSSHSLGYLLSMQ